MKRWHALIYSTFPICDKFGPLKRFISIVNSQDFWKQGGNAGGLLDRKLTFHQIKYLQWSQCNDLLVVVEPPPVVWSYCKWTWEGRSLIKLCLLPELLSAWDRFSSLPSWIYLNSEVKMLQVTTIASNHLVSVFLMCFFMILVSQGLLWHIYRWPVCPKLA